MWRYKLVHARVASVKVDKSGGDFIVVGDISSHLQY